MIKAILFDWGNTVMRAFPQFHGPMAKWPKVEAMPGILYACDSLSQRYKLYLATNSADSTTDDIRAALARVKLDTYFTAFFTATSLKCSKPSTHFYQQILSTLRLLPDEVLMVGDDIFSDVQGASNAGINSIWIDLDNNLSLNNHPVQSAEIRSAESLPKIVDNLSTDPMPTVSRCMRLLDKYAPGQNLNKHSQVVAYIAYLISRLCVENGLQINPILAHRGGFLHDLDKLLTLDGKTPHGEVGYDLLCAEGFPILAKIARSHPIFTPLYSIATPSTWEEKIVYIADKMVDIDQIVGIDIRINKLMQRYPGATILFQQIKPTVMEMENDLLPIIHMRREDLLNYLQRSVALMEQFPQLN